MRWLFFFVKIIITFGHVDCFSNNTFIKETQQKSLMFEYQLLFHTNLRNWTIRLLIHDQNICDHVFNLSNDTLKYEK